MIRALRAMASALRVVARAPVIILATYAVLVAAAVPAGAALSGTLMTAFERRALETVAPPRADDAWFGRASDVTHAFGEGSFSPAIVGFGIPLSTAADLAEQRLPSGIAAATLAVWMLAWATLLGGLLHRLAADHRIGWQAFFHACARRVAPFTALAVLTLSIYAGVGWFARTVFSEAGSFFGIGIVVGAAAVIASYTRAHIVTYDAGLTRALGGALHLIRTTPGACLTHVGIAAIAWVALLIAFAAADSSFGAGGGRWRAVVLIQLYLAARVVLRLVWEASALKMIDTGGSE